MFNYNVLNSPGLMPTGIGREFRGFGAPHREAEAMTTLMSTFGGLARLGLDRNVI